MQIILNNPYRIIGILAGTSLRDQTKQINRLKQYIEAEQDIIDDFSFPSLGDLNRTVERVNAAVSKLNLDSDKMSAALFWFYNGNEITDEPAFDFLKSGNFKDAVSLWARMINDKEVNDKTASAFFNLSTLMLNSALAEPVIKEDIFEKGLRLRLRFMESDYLDKLKEIATDGTYKASKKEIQLLFLNQLKLELAKPGGLSTTKILELFSNQSFVAKDEFLQGLAVKAIDEIQLSIDRATSKRMANNASALTAGKYLYNETKDGLNQLRGILTTANIKFSSISDKVSNEILDCGIDYFLFYRDGDTDPSVPAKELFTIAKSFAIGNIAVQRCREKTKELEDWIDDKPERERFNNAKVDLEKLMNILELTERKAETIANAKQLLQDSRIYLSNIKSSFGANDDIYLTLSTRIARDAQGMCTSEINKLMDRLNAAYDNTTKYATKVLLKQLANEAWDVIVTIGGMDLKQDFRTSYNSNRNTLADIKNQLVNVQTASSYASTQKYPTNKSSNGCFIATMAYGDYDHPQVMILRRFRDDVLDQSWLGKLFIKTYYRYSPKLVTLLKDKESINLIIRNILNNFINFIK